ncbi:MAG: thiol:disulfide interchange protein DsbA/DsbL [Steroidobacter sp.]
MNKLSASSLWIIPFFALAACGKQAPAPAEPDRSAAPAVAAEAPAAPPEADSRSPAETETPQPAEGATEAISETDEAVDAGAQTSTVQPSFRLGAKPSGPPTSAQFREGAHYQKIVPAQPTGVAPGKVEVAEVFWYGCTHCFSLDPAIESWRNKSKAPYIELVRVPAMWNEATRMHARLFYTAELLGKLEAVHPLIFREFHVNGNQLNTVEKITAFFKQHGVSPEEFTKAFSSFAVESKLQRADFLNRRYRVESVPMFVVNGKYRTDLTDAGGESQLFALIDELATHEHGG